MIKHRLHGLDPLVSCYVKSNIASRWIHPLRCYRLHSEHHKQDMGVSRSRRTCAKFFRGVLVIQKCGLLGLDHWCVSHLEINVAEVGFTLEVVENSILEPRSRALFPFFTSGDIFSEV